MAALIAFPVWGQQAVPLSIEVPTTTSAPPESSVDLLKKSFQEGKNSGQVVGVVSGNSRVKKAPPPESAATSAAPTQVSSSTATAQPVAQAASALPAQDTAVQPDKPAAVSANTLDMPLEMGGQTQSVQTSVAPAAKLSPKAASRVAASKAKREGQTAKQVSSGTVATPTQVEKDIEKENALLPSSSRTDEEAVPEEEAADAELEYAVKMLEKSKTKAQETDRPIPPSAAQNLPSKVPAPNKKFNPNAFRPGVTWLASKSAHFDIYTQKRTSGIPSSNMSMTFESAYQTLRRFIPWMMAGRVRVFIYQDHDSYLRYEPNARAWTRALAYPTRGEIVVYDEPGKAQALKEVFTHELTHIFTQQFFDSHKTGRIMTPTWLDEGLAVFMEDQTAGSNGGPWANDLKTLNFQRDPSQERPTFGSSSMFGSSSAKRFTPRKRGKPVRLVPFEQFMQEDSLKEAEGRNQVQNWYVQAYAMVRFLLNPSGGSTPSNRMQFEQFTRLIAQGEPKRNPSTGFLVKDSRGQTVYEPYSVEKALGRAYRYGSIANFEDNFWKWLRP